MRSRYSSIVIAPLPNAVSAAMRSNSLSATSTESNSKLYRVGSSPMRGKSRYVIGCSYRLSRGPRQSDEYTRSLSSPLARLESSIIPMRDFGMW